MLSLEVANEMVQSVLEELASLYDSPDRPALDFDPASNTAFLTYSTSAESNPGQTSARVVLYLAVTEDPLLAQVLQNQVQNLAKGRP